MARYVGLTVGTILVLVAAYLVWQPVSHFFAVDACLDQGGSFDYVAGACDFERSHPYSPDESFGGTYYLMAILVAIAGAGAIAVSKPRE